MRNNCRQSVQKISLKTKFISLTKTFTIFMNYPLFNHISKYIIVFVIDSFILSLKPELDPIDPKDREKNVWFLRMQLCKFLLISPLVFFLVFFLSCIQASCLVSKQYLVFLPFIFFGHFFYSTEWQKHMNFLEINIGLTPMFTQMNCDTIVTVLTE